MHETDPPAFIQCERLQLTPACVRQEPIHGDGEILWGMILKHQLDSGTLPRDHLVFAELLRSIRDTVQNDGEYKLLLSKYRSRREEREFTSRTKTTVRMVGVADEETEYIRDAVAYALMKAEGAPEFRNAPIRGRILDDYKSVLRDPRVPSIVALASPFVCEVLQVVVNSKRAR